MNDPFSYSARWDSIGLDCIFCKYETNAEWPNLNSDYSCNLHEISLAATLGKNGFKEGEWFCSNLEANNKADTNALKEFASIQNKLKLNVLYGGHGENKTLKEIPFSKLYAAYKK